MDRHLIPLAGDWALWRDFAVRSAGFPVGGLDVFGSGDESGRLGAIAADPLFGEAVIWQSRSAYRTAVAKIAGRVTEPGSKRRRRDGVVAGYWQRYCSKNDTVGFFGPLAWGAIRDTGPPIAVRSRGLVADRQVHFESWCLEALARAIDTPAIVPLNRRPEVDLRAQLEALGDENGLHALDLLESARAAVRDARGCEELLRVLDEFDTCFEELTGMPAQPSQDRTEGGRTPLYLDCMRDLDVELGPAIVNELALSLPLLFEASRWWCGRCFEHARPILAAALEDGMSDGPLEPLLHRVFGELWQLPRVLASDREELQDRCRAVLDSGDTANLAPRAARAFADHGPAWPLSVFHSVDIQIAAGDVAAIEGGAYLAVVGDFHSGNPLTQALFSTRFPDPLRFRAQWHADVGQPIIAPVLMRNPVVRVTSRNIADATNPDDIHLSGPGLATIHVGHRSVQLSDMLIRGGKMTDSAGTFSAPMMDLFFQPIFITAMKTFAPYPEVGPRIAVGRTVLRRAAWRTRTADRPSEASGVAAWAADLGLPRRVFCLAQGEAKPFYVDFESPALIRNLHRVLTRSFLADPDSTARFGEMLPGPRECWLEHQGSKYTSELRMVAVDRTRRGQGRVAAAPRRRPAASRPR